MNVIQITSNINNGPKVHELKIKMQEQLVLDGLSTTLCNSKIVLVIVVGRIEIKKIKELVSELNFDAEIKQISISKEISDLL